MFSASGRLRYRHNTIKEFSVKSITLISATFYAFINIIEQHTGLSTTKTLTVRYRCKSIRVKSRVGGDYRKDGGDASPPEILLGGRKGKRPPTIATFSKQKLDVFPF